MRTFQTYRHYKGGLYIKIGEALHSDTGEMMVIYICAMRGEMFCRPKEIFYSDVITDTYSGPRFTPLPDSMTQDEAKIFKSY